MNGKKLPQDWDENRVLRVAQHYERQTEDEALAEDEAALNDPEQATMEVPLDLVPAVRQLIARRMATLS
jgi:hypothetical protein